MWPFKKKKKEEEKAPSLSKPGEHKQNLPDLPRVKDKAKGFPSYDNELGEIKKAIDKPIPKYEGGLSDIKKSIDKQISDKGEPLDIPKRKSPFLKIGSKIKEPSLPVPKHHKVEHHEGSSKPIFVKLSNYKSAKTSLNKIKELAKEAEGLLTDLNQTREEEDRELSKWKSDIEKIKDNLLSIDKKMFEL
tara:strand:+ start:74 stop:640 length:567 start_codon:yes stop_codon:yes gene_type:complete